MTDIKLCEITLDDTYFMIRLVNDPEVKRYIPGMIADDEMMKAWISNLGESEHEFIVEADGVPVGECNLTVCDDMAEIGFMLLPEFWRRGYGTRIVTMLLEKAKALHITEITARTDSANTASVRLLTKTGFQALRTGWMLRISEDEDDDAPIAGQNIIDFLLTL